MLLQQKAWAQIFLAERTSGKAATCHYQHILEENAFIGCTQVQCTLLEIRAYRTIPT